MTHHDEDELSLHAVEGDAFADRKTAATHLAGCDQCVGRLEDVQRFERALGDVEPWRIARELTERPSPPPEALRALASRLDDERMAAGRLIRPLLRSPLIFRNADVAQDPSCRTNAAVRILSDAAGSLRQRQPAFALLVADAAVAIGTRLAADGELRTAETLGQALAERAAALFLIGRFNEAEQALRRAEDLYENDGGVSGWAYAVLWLLEANVCGATERHEEARALAAAAAREFRAHGDEARHLTTRLFEACLEYLDGRFGDAARLIGDVIVRARARNDLLLLARALQNAADCDLRLALFDRARTAYLEASVLWDELQLPLEKNRTNWGLAAVLVATGDLDEGIERLDGCRRTFEALGAMNDAALTRLHLAEAMLAAGRAAMVPDLLRDVPVAFASEGAMRNAKIALAYLRESVEGGRVDVSVIRNIRTYLEQLPVRPHASFDPRR